jgi:phosphoglycerate dehydrogenase-like enzyme
VVTATTRTPASHPACTDVRPMDDLANLLPASDFVVITLPGGPPTSGLFSRQLLARFSPGACLINIGRGEVIDETALTEAVFSGELSSAYLDVTCQEPLAADSPLWNTPGIHITPHIASWTTQRFDRAFDIFCSNLQRFQLGLPLLHRVFP